MISHKGNDESRDGGAELKVVCVWCGGVIRGAAGRAVKRMCQPCFARMMREHGRAHRQGASPRHASER